MNTRIQTLIGSLKLALISEADLQAIEAVAQKFFLLFDKPQPTKLELEELRDNHLLKLSGSFLKKIAQDILTQILNDLIEDHNRHVNNNKILLIQLVENTVTEQTLSAKLALRIKLRANYSHLLQHVNNIQLVPFQEIQAVLGKRSVSLESIDVRQHQPLDIKITIKSAFILAWSLVHQLPNDIQDVAKDSLVAVLSYKQPVSNDAYVKILDSIFKIIHANSPVQTRELSLDDEKHLQLNEYYEKIIIYKKEISLASKRNAYHSLKDIFLTLQTNLNYLRGSAKPNEKKLPEFVGSLTDFEKKYASIKQAIDKKEVEEKRLFLNYRAPTSYRNIAKKSANPIETAINLFRDYEKKYLFHWRHHREAARQIVAKLQQIQNKNIPIERKQEQARHYIMNIKNSLFVQDKLNPNKKAFFTQKPSSFLARTWFALGQFQYPIKEPVYKKLESLVIDDAQAKEERQLAGMIRNGWFTKI